MKSIKITDLFVLLFKLSKYAWLNSQFSYCADKQGNSSYKLILSSNGESHDAYKAHKNSYSTENNSSHPTGKKNTGQSSNSNEQSSYSQVGGDSKLFKEIDQKGNPYLLGEWKNRPN